MKRLLTLIVLVSLALIWHSCKEGDPEKIAPANLTVETTISTDGSGLVTFQATADQAVRFRFYFGDGLSFQESTDGQADHSYLASDTYEVTVTAFSVDELFIDKDVSITIDVDIPSAGYTTPDNYPNLNLAWQDEFDGPTLNSSDWNFEIGNGNNGWGNNELEYYQEQNTSFQDGHLIIKAKRENAGGKSYTSSRLTTQGKQAFKYGRVDIRALLPKGQGIWPALWMLGSSISTVGWPKCGEIDIMEMIGGSGRENTVYGTVHWDNAGNYATYGGNESLSGGATFADEFHVFSIVWDANFITWYLDDVQFHVIDITPAGLSEFNEEYFFIFNVAVGGNWPGSPDGTTEFPQRMVVDYIRVFQEP